MIGLSISFCVGDICRGKVQLDDIELIIAGTRVANSKEDWDKLVDQYQKVYWRKFPEEADAVLGWLLDNNKIEQPRLDSGDKFAPNIAKGCWVENFDQIIWDTRY